MSDPSDVVTVGQPPSICLEEVRVRYRTGQGRFVDTSLDRLPVDDVLVGMPVREVRWFRGRASYSGWYWSSTARGHVVYESRLELARILLADQDPDVAAIAAQPLLLEWFDGKRMRRHVPDLLLGGADGSVTVVDVKAASRLRDPDVMAQFDWTGRLCERRGFGFEVWSGADPVLLENVRFLAGYRRSGLVPPELLPLILDAAAAPVAVRDLERTLEGPDRGGLVRAAVLHLLWCARLATDLSRPLGGATLVRAEAVA